MVEASGPLEKDIEGPVCKYADARGVEHEKYKSQNRRGLADRIFFPGESRCFLIEFKKPGEKPRKLQTRVAVRMWRKGVPTYFIDNVEDGINVIKKELAKLSNDRG